jgi:endonuclease YncB( thermonuclease family)
MITRMILFFLLLIPSAYAEPVSVNDISVVDGDTIDYRGERYRMIDYDTPEISTARRKVSADEKAIATIELLKSGALNLTEVRCSCTESKIGTKQCNYGRKCGLLTLNGKNIGDTLIAEELAMPFICSRSRCPRMPDWPHILKEQK